MASSRCPNCRRWIAPGSESCECHLERGPNGYPAEGNIALMTANLVKSSPATANGIGIHRERLNIEREAEARWKAQNRAAEYQGEGGGVVNSGVIGGALAMVGAVIWFFAGIIYLDVIYLYPPILFVLGLMGVMKGLLGGKI